MKTIQLRLSGNEETHLDPPKNTNSPVEDLFGSDASKEAPKVQKEETITLSIKQLEELIDRKIVDGGDSKIEKLMQTLIRVSPKSNEPYGNVTESEIDFDDLLEEPVTFFSHTNTTTVYDDVKEGVSIQAPYNKKIKFVPFSRVKSQSGKKNSRFLCMSYANIQSKKQVEFLRNHSMFNVLYFENVGKNEIDSEKQNAIIQASRVVNSWNEMKMKSECISRGILINSMDVNVMTNALIEKVAQDFIDSSNSLKNKNLSIAQKSIKVRDGLIK